MFCPGPCACYSTVCVPNANKIIPFGQQPHAGRERSSYSSQNAIARAHPQQFKNIRGAFCGTDLFVLACDNEIVIWGNWGETEATLKKPLRMRLPFQVVKVSCAKFPILVSEEGKVYVLTPDPKGNKLPEPLELPPISVHTVSSGYEHHVILCDDGSLYGWGTNGDGQLALPRVENPKIHYVRPLPVPPLSMVCCGGYHTLGYTTTHTLLAWGRNNYGQLGCNVGTQSLEVPTPVDFCFEKIEVIACGWNHSMVMTKCGKLYGWGRNDCKQLGLKSEGTSVTRAEEVPCIGKALDVVCGGNHTLAVMSGTQEEKPGLYSWGYNNYGELGLGNRIANCLVSKIPLDPALDLLIFLELRKRRGSCNIPGFDQELLLLEYLHSMIASVS